jgi:hypothetical protein
MADRRMPHEAVSNATLALALAKSHGRFQLVAQDPAVLALVSSTPSQVVETTIKTCAGERLQVRCEKGGFKRSSGDFTSRMTCCFRSLTLLSVCGDDCRRAAKGSGGFVGLDRAGNGRQRRRWELSTPMRTKMREDRTKGGGDEDVVLWVAGDWVPANERACFSFRPRSVFSSIRARQAIMDALILRTLD